MTATHPDQLDSARPSRGTQHDSRSADRLLSDARALAPLIRQHAPEAEGNRRISPKVIAALRDAGFYRMLLPRSLGGLEVDPVTCSLVVEEIARADSAAAWTLQAGNTGAWWSARLPAEGVEEIYGANPSVLQAAAFHPPQRAVEVPGGFRITGRGPLASTIHDAEWLFLSAVVMDGDQPRLNEGMPVMIAFVIRAQEARIEDTWRSLGMRGTDSNDVIMDDVFVPASRTFPLMPMFEPNPYFSGPLYRFPGMAAVIMVIAPVALAVGRGAVDEFRELARRKAAFGFTAPLSQRAPVQGNLARAEGMLRAARLLYFDTLAAVWRTVLAGEPATLEQKADLALAGAHAANTAAMVAGMMHQLAGTTGIYERSPLERHFRDANTLKHHGFMSENRFEAVGQVYLGVQPEFPLIGF
jgi:alkylation response protein AidB-like acyl-CoA dehydrogenase